MAQAIAAEASLALAVKLTKIFEKEDKYLTFPTGLGFSYSYLEFMKDPLKTSLSAQEQLNFKADFSRQMNLIPEDNLVFMPDASRFLWDEVKSILTDSVFAESALTQEEENQLAKAVEFLTDYQGDPDGSKVPVNSPQVSKYYEFKTLYEEAERNYLDEKLSVQFAKGPDAQKLIETWDAYREKQLKEASNKAEQDWVNLGYKRQVEECQAQQNCLELRKYLNLYRQSYLDELKISEISDLHGKGIGFWTTFFSPDDAFDKQLPWTSITLTKAELVGLLNETPPELKTMFGAEQGNVGIELMSLEYNNIIVIRPWFKPEFFASRYWKLPDSRVISNGLTPRKGRLPAFITSIIVARNVRITRRKDVAQQPVVLPLLSKVPIHTLKLSALPVATPTPIARPPVEPLAGRPIVIAGRLMKLGAKTGEADLLAHKTHALYSAAKYKGMTIHALGDRPIIHPKPGVDLRLPPQNGQLVTETINLDGVSVLALVCKRLPRSPDPDSSLPW